MGVTGLWQVVQPCARPTNIATLNKKRLAVDASIWIYQFLKAVRDKEGNAFRSSHVVGFFRRICKLLWFGILPVFVFDGGVPPLKRQTILNRKQRREGRREDATKTAGRLLTVQMQRYAEMEIEKQRKKKARKKGTQAAKKPEAETAPQEEQEELPDFKDIVYVDELGMPEAERLQKRKKFVKQDPYHLPELTGNIEDQANPDDPRIMSVEQLAHYAEQFGDGGDINLYDFSNIDFEGEFFRSLPPVDRYWILNAARLRSRLRMGLSKEQLEAMFPNRMDFSRFQIERVRERNHLTQLLMKELGMAGLDLTISGGVGNRIASDQNREYILVKNDGAEGGWALGVISRDKDLGRRHKPIDIDAMTFEFEGTDNLEEDEDEEFEDVPVEGLNCLPRTEALAAYSRRRAALASQANLEEPDDDDDVMFVGGPSTKEEEELFYNLGDTTAVDEQDNIQKAIELSLKTQHNKAGISTGFSTQDLNDVKTPTWEQKAVDTTRTLPRTAAKLNLNMLNKRATTEVSSPITKEATVLELNPVASDESDSDIDLQTALAMSQKAQKGQATTVPKPTALKVPTADSTGPLPFPKLDWNFKKPQPTPPKPVEPIHPNINEDVFEFGGGFEVSEEPTETEKDGPKNGLPPWMAEEEDIAEGLRRQQEAQRRMDAQDREHACLEHMIFQEFRPSLEMDVVEISDSDEDIQFVDVPTPEAKKEAEKTDADLIDIKSNPISWPATLERLKDESPEPEFKDIVLTHTAPQPVTEKQDSPGPEFIDTKPKDTEPVPEQQQIFEIDDDELFGSGASESEKDGDSVLREYEEEQLLAQMAEEADEHARFSNELHNRPKDTAHDSIEAELSQLRNQQRKDRRDADEVTENMILECQALLRLFGIPFITAPMEAEAQCAELVKLGLVDGVITDDSDTFLFGGTRVYKNMFNTSKFVECYIAEDLQQEMSLNRTSLISLAQLLGSDYTEGLPGVGPVTAVEILSEFPGYDGLLEFKKWWEDVQANRRPKEVDASSAFRKKFRQNHGTKLFLPSGFPSLAVHEAYMRPDVDSSKENFQWGVPDLDGLRRFLMSTIGWGQERTDEVLVPVIKDMNRREREGTQSNITKYFQGGVGVGASDAFAPRQRIQGSSKRMAQAVNKLRKATLADGPESESTENEPSNPALLRNTKRKRVTKQKSKKGGDDDIDGLYEGEDKDNEGSAGDQFDNQSQRSRRRCA